MTMWVFTKSVRALTKTALDAAGEVNGFQFLALVAPRCVLHILTRILYHKAPSTARLAATP